MSGVSFFGNVVQYPESIPTLGFSGVREKPPGGTEVGHIAQIDGQSIIFKVGNSVSLLAIAIGKYLKSPGEEGAREAKRFLGFLVGNYKNIHRLTDEEERGLIAVISDSFDKLLEEEPPFLKRLREHETPDAIDAEALFQYFVLTNPWLPIPIFSDLIAAAFGQAINNVFQQSQELHVAESSIYLSSCAQVYTASTYLSDAIPLHNFLLEPFNTVTLEGDLMTAIEAGKATLRAQLAAPIQGLLSAILIRLVLGESADIGPDNMILVSADGALQLVNIDISGFRYNRQAPFSGRFGWEEIFRETEPAEIRRKLLSDTVFCNRFINKARPDLPKPLQLAIFHAITEVLSSRLSDREVLSQRNAVVRWFGALDLDQLMDSFSTGTKRLHGLLPAVRQIPLVELSQLIRRDQEFLLAPFKVAREVMDISRLAGTHHVALSGLGLPATGAGLTEDAVLEISR